MKVKLCQVPGLMIEAVTPDGKQIVEWMGQRSITLNREGLIKVLKYVWDDEFPESTTGFELEGYHSFVPEDLIEAILAKLPNLIETCKEES